MSDIEIFQENIDIGYTEETQPASSEEFFKVIENRRSIRVFQDIDIPNEVIEKSLDAALKAPNSSNLQTWKFYRIKDKEVLKKVAHACLSQPAAKTAKEIIVSTAKLSQWKMTRDLMIKEFEKQKQEGVPVPDAAFEYYKNIVPLAYNQGPLGIIGFFKSLYFKILGLKKPIPREPVNKADMRVWAHKSAALACENFMLAMSAQGFDTCPMEGYDSSRLKKILNLDSDEEVVMALGCGKRDPKKVYGPRLRFEKELFIKTI